MRVSIYSVDFVDLFVGSRQALTRVLNLEKDAAVGRSTAQVAHDIRSPLAALSMVARNAHKLDEDERLVLRAAADRISEIAGSLLLQRKSSHQGLAASNPVRQVASHMP